MHRLATVHARDNQRPTNDQRRHDTAYLNKRLFYWRKVRRLIIANQVIGDGTITEQPTSVTMCLSRIVSEIFNVKWWRALNIWLMGSFKVIENGTMLQTTDDFLYQSAIAIVSIALPGTNSEMFDFK